MGILSWILLGAISGWVASLAVNDRGSGCLVNMALGLVGAMVGGFIFSSIGGSGINGFNLYSMLVAIVGAVVVLVVYHAITGRRGLH